MNAQEAIEMMENKLKVEKKHVEKIIAENKEALPEDVKELWRSKVDALSIVLESAKLLHGHVIPQMESQYERMGQGFKSVYGVPIEKLGIEKGADE